MKETHKHHIVHVRLEGSTVPVRRMGRIVQYNRACAPLYLPATRAHSVNVTWKWTSWLGYTRHTARNITTENGKASLYAGLSSSLDIEWLRRRMGRLYMIYELFNSFTLAVRIMEIRTLKEIFFTFLITAAAAFTMQNWFLCCVCQI